MLIHVSSQKNFFVVLGQDDMAQVEIISEFTVVRFLSVQFTQS